MTIRALDFIFDRPSNSANLTNHTNNSANTRKFNGFRVKRDKKLSFSGYRNTLFSQKKYMSIHLFTFNAFQENTYVLVNALKQAIIIDPGMTDESEDAVLFDFIERNGLTPVYLLNTHCHIDHILGNAAVVKKYGVPFYAHKNEIAVLERAGAASLRWDIPYRESPMPTHFIDEGDRIEFGEHSLDVIFVPGHAPGHVAFIDHEHEQVISGDVLFDGSVGRVDLPGCNAQDLVDSVQKKMYALPDQYVVHPGHGGATTIGKEKKTNYFIGENYSRF
jgi:hydroxyacylglutathione hydrolase